MGTHTWSYNKFQVRGCVVYAFCKEVIKCVKRKINLNAKIQAENEKL